MDTDDGAEPDDPCAHLQQVQFVKSDAVHGNAGGFGGGAALDLSGAEPSIESVYGNVTRGYSQGVAQE